MAILAASSGSLPSASWTASTDECVQPEPWAAPSAWRDTADLLELLTVEEDVREALPVPAGDDDHLRTESVQSARQLVRVGMRGHEPSASTRASGRFGVMTVARGSSRVRSASRASFCSRMAPLSATITGSITIGTSPDQVECLVDGIDRREAAEHPDLDGVDADVVGDGAHLRDDRGRRYRLHVDHADRVLRSDRRDRGHAVGAAASESLQVGLNPGAAAGVRTGDRQQAWWS